MAMIICGRAGGRLGLLAAVLLAACSSTATSTSVSTSVPVSAEVVDEQLAVEMTPDQEVIARYRGGSITVAERDSWRATHPDLAGDGPLTRVEAERIVLAEHLAAVAVDRGADRVSPLRDDLQRSEDRLLAQALRRHVIAGVTVDQAEVEAAYTDHPKAFHKPPRRRLRHLYKRFPLNASAADQAAVRGEVAKLRREILAGADFAELARQRSDSQSRFRDGLIGNVARGDLPAEVEAVVWSLDPGAVSAAIESTDGLTLFYVEKILAAVVPTAAEIKRRLAENLERMAQKNALAELESKLAGGADVDQETLAHLVAAEARKRGLADSAEIRARLHWKRLDTLTLAELHSRVTPKFAEPTEADVRAYFEQHGDSIRVPPKYRLGVIALPIEAGRERESSRAAEALRIKIASGALAFADAAKTASVHPSSDDGGALGWISGPRLAGYGANVWKAVTALEAGTTSEVVEQDGTLWIVRVEAVEPRRTATFEEAAERAKTRLANERLAALQQEVETEVLVGLDIHLLR